METTVARQTLSPVWNAQVSRKALSSLVLPLALCLRQRLSLSSVSPCAQYTLNVDDLTTPFRIEAYDWDRDASSPTMADGVGHDAAARSPSATDGRREFIGAACIDLQEELEVRALPCRSCPSVCLPGSSV
eukprot:SAG22_NODE_276_length_13167_cov_8.415825_3_plen_131_part_00